MGVETRALGLRSMREKREMSEGQLADALGVTADFVQSLESGTLRPSATERVPRRTRPYPS